MDGADGSAVAPQISSLEAEAYVEALEPLPLESYASPKWYRQHEYLEKLNLQAHHNIIHRGDEFVYEALCDLDKIPIVIHELIAAEVWKTKLWPLIKDSISDHSSIRAYNALYHEATVSALLEAVMFHSAACEAGEDTLMELVDYCARKMGWLLHRPKPRETAMTAKEMLEVTENTQKQLEEQLDEVNFSCAMIALTMLRYMTDNMEKLHVSVVQRMVTHHDFVALLVPLLDMKPWYKKTTIKVELPLEEGQTKPKIKKRIKHEKFGDNKWTPVEPNDRTLGKPEAQVWLALNGLIMSAGRAEQGFGYHIDESKKGVIERLKKYFNDVLCDQLPPLTPLRRVVEEISMMQCRPDPGSSFIIEQVSEMREAMIEGRNWGALARQQLQDYFSMTQKERMAEVMRMNDLYSAFDLGDLQDGGRPSDSVLLDKHGAVGLAKLYLTGGEGLEKDLSKAASYFRLAADKGDAEAQYCLGQRLKKGQGVGADPKEAERFFVLAAEQGHANAMNWLGHMYDKGDGVAQCSETAVRWNERAALAGDSWAQTKMGMRLLKGEGLPNDPARAKGWLVRAAANGSKAAAQKLASGEMDGVQAVEPPAPAPAPAPPPAPAPHAAAAQAEAEAKAAFDKARGSMPGGGPSTAQMRAFLESAEGEQLLREAQAEEARTAQAAAAASEGGHSMQSTGMGVQELMEAADPSKAEHVQVRGEAAAPHPIEAEVTSFDDLD